MLKITKMSYKITN